MILPAKSLQNRVGFLKLEHNNKNIYNNLMEEKYYRARELRKNSTPQEQKIWNIIKDRKILGLRFVRQYPIGKYIVDFACRKEKIIIEIDGSQHNEDENILYDKERTAFLKSKGYKVIRFWNNDVDNNIDGIYEYLIYNLKQT